MNSLLKYFAANRTFDAINLKVYDEQLLNYGKIIFEKRTAFLESFIPIFAPTIKERQIMRTVQFREAICEAMSEEMRQDPSIYLMGEEVAEYNGAYKASKGMLDEFGEKRVIDTPISELGFSGIGVIIS